MKVNGLSSDQPPLDRTRDQMSPGEQEVDFFFSDAEKVSKLIKFLSLEDKKGRDKFHALHFYMFKVCSTVSSDRPSLQGSAATQS